ncbi:hypothetical protein [Pontixanthobacter sp. CEM42]|uniref:ATP-grasp domain-containing protein n=1 Tax=Pontixanthobacter sp. CEM42 TaxID=2792077 RepID=UPI001ADFD6E8|nr:hypothetical protein [Pontixanthobacter sp. CEM42]
MKIGFLACPETMPAAGTSSGVERRGDAFEHDLQVDALRPAFAAAGLELIEIEWRAPLDQFADIRLVLIGTSWDYQDYPDEFLIKLEALQSVGVIVCNSPELIRWNIDKSYLKELERRGTRTIPTLWSDDPDYGDVTRALAHFKSDKVVVKRQTGAGALGQHIFDKESLPDEDWQMGHKAMIQPFLAAIQDEGELSFVFIDGAFSHAIQKTTAKDEYRIQSLYGGQETAITPSDDDIAAALSVLQALPGDTPLYARIDMLRADTEDSDGALVVMEAEAIEPFLYPVQGPELGKRMADAIIARL